MCTTADDAGPHSGGAGAGFGSVLEALRAGRAVADCLNSPAARDLGGAACGEALVQIGMIASGLAAAQNGLLRRFDADSAHDADGYASTAAWLAGQTGYLAGKDAEAIACDALIVPIVTGSPDWNVIARMITLVSDYHARAHDSAHHGGGPGQPPGEAARSQWPQSLPPQEQEELLYAVARLAIDFVSGPDGSVRATGPQGQIIHSHPPPTIPAR